MSLIVVCQETLQITLKIFLQTNLGRHYIYLLVDVSNSSYTILSVNQIHLGSSGEKDRNHLSIFKA